MNSFIKDIFRVGLSNIIMIVCGLVSSIVTARYLGPEKNGIIAALLVYPGLFMTVGSLGIRQSATFFLGRKIYTEEEIKTAITQIWMLTTIGSLIICFFLMKEFSNSGNNQLWILLALIPLPFSLFNTYNAGIFLGKNDIKTFNQINWLPSFVSLLGLVLLVIVVNFEITGVLLSAIFGPLFISSILLFKNDFIKSFSLKYNWKIIKSMLTLGIVYAIALFVINLNYRIDIIILDKLSNPYELGIYSKGAGITQYLWQIPMVLSTIVFARSAVAKEDVLFSYKVAQLLRISFVFVTIISFVLIVAAPQIIYIMFGIDFSGSIRVLQTLLPGVIILTVFKVMNMDLAGKGKPWVSLKAMTPALILNVILNIYLIPVYGAMGASISSTASYSLAGLLFLFFYSKEIDIPVRTIITFQKGDFDPLKKMFQYLNNNNGRI